MDIFNLWKVERTAYKNMKQGVRGKDLAKELVKPGLLFCAGTILEAIVTNCVDSILEKYMEEWD